ncbi:MAG TPA: hypothetical protein VNC63_04520, partial [Propionibacteriaceae bacterium]|nr:hypothetical protein [Propionibacteriaceae bacterium]
TDSLRSDLTVGCSPIPGNADPAEFCEDLGPGEKGGWRSGAGFHFHDLRHSGNHFAAASDAVLAS